MIKKHFGGKVPKIDDSLWPVENINVMYIVVDFKDGLGDGGGKPHVVDEDEEVFELVLILLRQREGEAEYPEEHLFGFDDLALVLVVVAEGVAWLDVLVQVLQVLDVLQ